MAVDPLRSFWREYDGWVTELSGAAYKQVPDFLLSWYRALDTTTDINTIIRRLEGRVDFEKWSTSLALTSSDLPLRWPDDPEDALGMKLQLFRMLNSRAPEEIAIFAKSHLDEGRGPTESTQALIRQIFLPMARELKRYIEQEIEEGPSEKIPTPVEIRIPAPTEIDVPASDRVVTLDHNSDPYQRTLDALDDLVRALRGANDYPNADDKEQRIAEVEATKTLLKPKKVSIAAVVAVIGGTLAYIAQHFVGTAVDMVAHNVIEKLTALLGPYF